MKFWIWRLRVCLYGWLTVRVWPWSHISTDDWREYYADGMSPSEQFNEGWLRDDDLHGPEN